MRNKILRFGIIGTGSIALTHAKSIADIEGCELISVASSNSARANSAKERFGVKAFSDYHELLGQEEIDVVCVCTESGKHLEVCISAANAGKHIICEKPLEINAERGSKIIAACEKNGVKLGVIFQNRLSPDFKRLKQAISENELGKILFGNAYIKWYRNPDYYGGSPWRGTLLGDGGAVLINQGIHTIDLLINILGIPKSVFAKTRTMVHTIEGEDVGIALLEFENGCLGTIEGSTAAYPGLPERLEIFGEKGSVILEGGKVIHWQTLGKSKTQVQSEVEVKSGASDPTSIGYELHKLQIEDMAQAIWENRNPIIDGNEGLLSLILLDAIYKSSKLGKEVFI